MSNYGRNEEFSLELLRQGDRAEFARMVDAYSPIVYRLGLKMLNNEQDAEDLLQDTFIKVFRHLEDFDGRSSLSTWLYRIATNEALMVLRRKSPQIVSVEEPGPGEDGDQEPLQIVDWCCVPEKELMSAEGRKVLDRAIDTLPAGLRLVFLLRDIEGLSTRETAEIMDLTEMAVKTRLSRARLHLRDELTRYYGDRLTGDRDGA